MKDSSVRFFRGLKKLKGCPACPLEKQLSKFADPKKVLVKF